MEFFTNQISFWYFLSKKIWYFLSKKKRMNGIFTNQISFGYFLSKKKDCADFFMINQIYKRIYQNKKKIFL